ncbi:MAG: response regulator transcription factor [Chloroflexi bacterium]|nr:response regulator transcription factor [Chloroflexota bacterium]
MQALREMARPRTALIAEDDKRIGELVEEALTEAGFETRYVADGVAAINEILESKPDVVVLDLVLPRLRGQDVCSMVRKSPVVNRTAIVVISGAVPAEGRPDVFRLGADDFVSKPFRPDELVARVQAVCHRAAHRQRFAE